MRSFVKQTFQHKNLFPFIHHKRKSLFLLVFAAMLQLTSLTTFSQQYNFVQYSIKEGLAQSQVRCVFQDSRGYIWAGTLGGLSRFDGKKFLNYNRSNGLLNNQINCITELRDGSIAAGSNGSVAIVNGLGTKIIKLPAELSESTINTLFSNGDNNLWIGTENGLCIYDNGTFVLHPELGTSHIKSILNHNGSIYVLTKEKIYLATSTTAETFFSPSNPETTFFDFAHADGSWWLASKGEGLVKLNSDGNSIPDFTADTTLAATTLTGVVPDENNHLWLTSRFGFFQYDGASFKSYTEKNGLRTPDVRDLIRDRDGNIWIATYGSGLLKFSGDKFYAYTTTDGLSSNAVMSIAEDRDHNIWLSTFDKGISKYTAGNITAYDLAELTGNNRIWTSLYDAAGNLWFGSSDGLFKYDGKKFTQYTTEDSLSDNMVLSLLQDRNNTLWIGTPKGITLFENGKFSPFVVPGAPQKRVRSIKEDKAGKIWIASNDGVYEYDGQTIKVYTQSNGLPENSAFCIEVDSENKIWVGTQNGIALKSGNEFVTLRIDETSGSNVINFFKYHKGHIWIGTNNGLFVREISLTNSGQFRHFVMEDGLRSLETNLNAVFIDHNEVLWFGTTDGVMCVNTEELFNSKPALAPLISFEKIQINLQDQDWNKLSDSIDAQNGLPVNLSLDHTKNHLTFYFNGISTTYPADIRYRYMLEGLDEEWKPITDNNFATYSNLPHSKFTFKVSALNKEGVWSEPISYSFEIRPPFWLTWWFIALEILAAGSILGFIYYSRRKAFKSKQEKEWFEIRSKLLALEQQSLNSSMNRHFIFNALNSIQYYINRQDKLAANKYLTDFAKLIRKNLDSSEDNLTTLRDEIERLELYLKLEHMRFKDKFEYKIHVDSTIDQNSIKVPAMMVQPFLENSIWHGLLPKQTQGLVDVDISKKDGRVCFSITDNGVGFENSLKSKIGTDNHISKGMGITQSRIDLIKKATGQNIELRGPYQLNDENGQALGTRVEIILPANFHELFSN